MLAVGLVGLFAVVASGWPGFGAKVGGTIALVPCLLLLMAWLAGIQVRWRWAVPVAVSGLALFFAFAVISYFFPAAGVSDMGTFAGNLLHGRGGDLLERKVSSNVGTLTVTVFGWLIPVVAVAAAAALWRPAALRLRTAGAGVRGGAAGCGSLAWLVLAGPRDRLVRRRLRGDRARGGAAVRGAIGDLDGRLRFRSGRLGHAILVPPSPGHPSQARPRGKAEDT